MFRSNKLPLAPQATPQVRDAALLLQWKRVASAWTDGLAFQKGSQGMDHPSLGTRAQDRAELSDTIAHSWKGHVLCSFAQSLWALKSPLKTHTLSALHMSFQTNFLVAAFMWRAAQRLFSI